MYLNVIPEEILYTNLLSHHGQILGKIRMAIY